MADPASPLQDVIQTILPPSLDFMPELTNMITGLGFDSSVMDNLFDLIGYKPPASS